MKWNSDIQILLNSILSSQDKHKFAVFDADGTLWHDDIGESFFQHQIDHDLSPGLANIKNPFQNILKRK